MMIFSPGEPVGYLYVVEAAFSQFDFSFDGPAPVDHPNFVSARAVIFQLCEHRDAHDLRSAAVEDIYVGFQAAAQVRIGRVFRDDDECDYSVGNGGGDRIDGSGQVGLSCDDDRPVPRESLSRCPSAISHSTL